MWDENQVRPSTSESVSQHPAAALAALYQHNVQDLCEPGIAL